MFWSHTLGGICYTVKCHLYIRRWVGTLQHIFLHGNLAQRIVNATCQSMTSVINTSCSLPACVDNACCQYITHVDIEMLYLSRGFEKGLRIGSIPDILDWEFEESVVRIIPSYPQPYHSSPISASHFMEEGKRNLVSREYLYIVGLSIEARGKEYHGAIC